MGDVKETTLIGTTDWTSGLTGDYYKLFMDHATSSAMPLKLYSSTTTAAGISFTPYGTTTSVASASYLRRRISQTDMRAIVDRLVKERYPAYDPNDR